MRQAQLNNVQKTTGLWCLALATVRIRLRMHSEHHFSIDNVSYMGKNFYKFIRLIEA
jgi:hypothetical protein